MLEVEVFGFVIQITYDPLRGLRLSFIIILIFFASFKLNSNYIRPVKGIET